MLRAAFRSRHAVGYRHIVSTAPPHHRQISRQTLPPVDAILPIPHLDEFNFLEDPADLIASDPAPLSSWTDVLNIPEESLDEIIEQQLPSPFPTHDDLAESTGRSRMEDAFLYSPKEQLAYERQLALEENTIQDAVNRYRKENLAASQRGDVVTHRNASHLLHAWFAPLTLAVKNMSAEHASPKSGKGKKRKKRDGSKKVGRKTADQKAADLLTVLPSDAIAVLTIHVVLAALMREANGVSLSRLSMALANNVRAEVNLKKINALTRKEENHAKEQRASSRKDSTPFEERRSAKTVLQHALNGTPVMANAINYAAEKVSIPDAEWSQRDMALLGATLIDLLLKTAVVEKDGKFFPAFKHFKRRRKGHGEVGMLQLTDEALAVVGDEPGYLSKIVLPKQKPMLVRPRPWISTTEGAYLRCGSHLVRYPAHSNKRLFQALAGADLSPLYDGLNALGEQEWRVNRFVLRNSVNLWDNGGGVAGLVTKTNCELPKKAEFFEQERQRFDKWVKERRKSMTLNEDGNEYESDEEITFNEDRAKRRLRNERRKVQKMNRELVSMRADTNHRIEQAKEFASEDRIWLPHNVDFRGRAYPMAVHLQHMGCDLTRALLTFAQPGVELGKRGVYWLKIHLANLLGADKLPFDERIAYAENALSKAIEVGRDPLCEANLDWWASAEDPFQLLAACGELADAVGMYGGESALEKYHSSLPISMDGSCNGLQHYAALGRDVAGGIQVNLVPNSRPQDVYSGVAELVTKKVDELAEQGDEICQIVRGKVSRKVVKQTVMTSVYGVTRIGARQQIQNRLAEIEGFPEEKLFPVAMKLATLTLSSLGDIFNGASMTMDWLAQSAMAIAKEGHEVQWTTPLGLPVVQPYRQSERVVVKTLMQRVSLKRERGSAPVSSQRQRSAFAPNYVHSLDSAHMLLTAVKCRKEGVNFAAVHDSFWTNAASVDTMNRILRNEFIELHQRDLLNELRESFIMRHPNVKFDELPARGGLDLEVVRDSPYFFS